MGSSRSHVRLRQKNGRGRLVDAHSDGDFRIAVTEAAALHARDDLFAKHITPEPAEEASRVWAMAEEGQTMTKTALHRMPMPKNLS